MTMLLISAPSGAGKTTIMNYLKNSMAHQNKNTLGECVSHTTRPMREGEVHGKDYYFVNREEFEDYDTMGGFAESLEYDGNLYGVCHEEIARQMNSKKHVYIIVEYNGYKQIKELHPDAVGIFLYMSKEDCMANMLLRGDSIPKATSRIEKYDEEIKNRSEFDYVIKNVREKMRGTAEIIESIIYQNS